MGEKQGWIQRKVPSIDWAGVLKKLKPIYNSFCCNSNCDISSKGIFAENNRHIWKYTFNINIDNKHYLLRLFPHVSTLKLCC